jgi:hypothetical protein
MSFTLLSTGAMPGESLHIHSRKSTLQCHNRLESGHIRMKGSVRHKTAASITGSIIRLKVNQWDATPVGVFGYNFEAGILNLCSTS